MYLAARNDKISAGVVGSPLLVGNVVPDLLPPKSGLAAERSESGAGQKVK